MVGIIDYGMGNIGSIENMLKRIKVKSTITSTDLGQLSGGLIEHFLETLAREGKFNMHINMLSGSNNHHKAESIFKGLARAIKDGVAIDPRSKSEPTSTKGTISK